MRQQIDNERIVVDFDDVSDLLEFVVDSPPVWRAPMSSRTDLPSFRPWVEQRIARLPGALPRRHVIAAAIRQAAKDERYFHAALRHELIPVPQIIPMVETLLAVHGISHERYLGELRQLGTKTWAEAVELAETGWREGGRRLAAVARRHVLVAPAPPRQEHHDYAGEIVDIAEYLSGNPQYMRTGSPSQRPTGEAVRIFINARIDNDVASIAIENAAAAVVALADALASLGHAVEVHRIAHSLPPPGRDSGPELVIRLPLKPAGEPLDIDRLAFWCLNPAAAGRMETAIRERLDIEAWYGDGNGTADAESIRRQIDAGAILIATAEGFASVDAALACMAQQLPTTLVQQMVR